MSRSPARLRPQGQMLPHRAHTQEDETFGSAAAMTEQRSPDGIEQMMAFMHTLNAELEGAGELQAAIAALHDEAASPEQTDWPQILALYEVLERVSPGPVVTLNRAVAVAMMHGPRAGLALLGTLDDDARMAHTHRLEVVRGHLLERADDLAAARTSFLRAARMTASLPEQHYLALRAARFDQP